MDGAWPLVGRDEELAFLAECLDGRSRGGVVLAGEAGCGKTRLALELLERGRDEGFKTFLFIADPSTADIPLAPFSHLVEPAHLDTDDQLRLLVQAREALELARGDRRLLLAVDDAHCLDDLSAALVHQAAASFAVVVTTLRSGETAPDRIAALSEDGLLPRVELQPLSWPDVQELLERVLEGPMEGRTLHRLWTASRGNVMHLREVVLGGLDTGSLRWVEGGWVWDGPLVVPRLADLVGSRLATLPDQELYALSALAVGEPMTADVLGQVARLSAIRSLEERGLIQADEARSAPVLRLAHPLYREVLDEQMAPMEARSIKKRLLDVFEGERTGDFAGRELKVAQWSVELGEHREASELTDAAAATDDPALGEWLARAAVDAGGGPRARAVLGLCLYCQVRGEEAEQVLAELDPELDPVGVALSALDLRVGNLFFVLGRREQALEVLSMAEETVEDGEWRARFRVRRADIHLFSGETERAVELATDLCKEPSLPRYLRPRAAWIAGVGLALQGRSKAGGSLIDQASAHIDLADEGEIHSYATLMTARFLGLWFSGSIDAAEALARAGYELITTHPRSELHGIAALGLGRIALARGNVRKAIGRFEEAASVLRAHDTTGFVVFALSGLAQARALSGDVDASRLATREAQHRRMAVRIFDADLELARAWSATAAGAFDEARVAAIAGADAARRMGQHASEVVALHDAIRLGAGPEISERLIDRARIVEGEFASACSDHAAGVLASDPERIERASERFEGTGALLLAAECASRAASLHLDAGRGQRARAASARTRVLAEACQGAHTPLLWRAGDAVRLTPRELEIAQLASSGRSDKEIAERLAISLRTVENHLHQVYAKLGISGRRELGESLVSRSQV